MGAIFTDVIRDKAPEACSLRYVDSLSEGEAGRSVGAGGL